MHAFKLKIIALSFALSSICHAVDTPVPGKMTAAESEGILWSRISVDTLMQTPSQRSSSKSAAISNSAGDKSTAVRTSDSSRSASEPEDEDDENDGDDEGEENTKRLIRNYELEQQTTPDQRKALYNHAAKNLPQALNAPFQPWQPLGIGIFRNADRPGSYATAGRVSAAQYAYDRAQGFTVLWAAGAGGGLWKAINVGLFAFWAPVSRSMPDPTVGAFLVDRSNSDHLFIGTGNSWRWSGSGLYRSIDAGETWTPVSLASTPAAFYKILQDRSNPNVMLAASDTGLYRSDTGGNSWLRVYTGDVSDIAQDPRTPSHWYAGLFGVGVLESTNFGAEFHMLNGDGGASAGLAGPFGRISLTVCDAAPNYIYALVEYGLKLKAVYRSDNFGASWVPIHGANGNKSQGSNLSIAVHPSDPNRVVIGLTSAEMTSNATTASPTWANYNTGHSDISSLLFVPDSFSPGNTQLIVTSDGGIYSTNYATGTVNDTLNTLGLNVEEVMAGSNLAGSRSNPDLLLTGLQDNGIVSIDPAGVHQHAHGDGGQVSISPDNADHFYVTAGVDWDRAYSLDHGATWQSILCDFDWAEWVPLLLVDPRPGLPAANVFSASVQHDAVVTGWQDLNAMPLNADETLTIMVNGVTVTANLRRGDNIAAVVVRIQAAFTAAGLGGLVEAANANNFLTFQFPRPGSNQSLSVVSNRNRDPGTTGIGTTANTANFSWSAVRYKPANTPSCDWRPVGTDSLGGTPVFNANYVEKAMNPFYDVLYLTHWGDSRLFVYDSQFDGPMGAMTRHEVRTPPLAPRTSGIDDGRAIADRSVLQWDTVYYTTLGRRPSQAFLSTDRGQSWSDVTGNLARLAPNATFYQLIGKPGDLNELFLATSIGVFYSHDRGRSWEAFNQGLPALTRVSAMALQFDNATDPKLYIGTLGQGFWSRSLSDHIFQNGFD